MSGDEDFFSVARTMPLVALMPRDVTPWLTALRAYSTQQSVSRVCRVASVAHTNLDKLAAVKQLDAAQAVN